VLLPLRFVEIALSFATSILLGLRSEVMTPSAFGDTRSPAGAKRGLVVGATSDRVSPGVSSGGSALRSWARGGAIVPEQSSLPTNVRIQISQPQLTGC
jgi:hypothetical protein